MFNSRDETLSAIHVVPTINEQASGPSYSVTRLHHALNTVGCDTKLAILKPCPEGLKSETIKAFAYGLGYKQLGRSPAMREWLRNRAQSGELDIIHNHSLWMTTNTYGSLAVKNTSAKLVVAPRGTMSKAAMTTSLAQKKLLKPWLYDRAFKNVSAFHATCEAEYEDIRRLGFTQPVAIIPNGVDERPARTPAMTLSRTLLYLGRVHPLKGIENLLTAWSRLEDKFPDWNLSIVGPGEVKYVEALRAQSQSLGLKNVRFVGALYDDEKWKTYEDADLFVLPTFTENFAMTVAEALSCGTPAIVTKGAPWAELDAKGAGYWIDIGADPLTECLEKALAQSSSSLNRMGEKGRKWMASDFAWDSLARKMCKFYGWLKYEGTPPDFVKVN